MQIYISKVWSIYKLKQLREKKARVHAILEGTYLCMLINCGLFKKKKKIPSPQFMLPFNLAL